MCGLFNLKHVSPGGYHHIITENSYPNRFLPLYENVLFSKGEKLISER